jgi:hypothetical protein
VLAGRHERTACQPQAAGTPGTCQTSPATLLTAIDLRCTSDVPGIDLALTCAATGREVVPGAGQHRNHADTSDSACYCRLPRSWDHSEGQMPTDRPVKKTDSS